MCAQGRGCSWGVLGLPKKVLLSTSNDHRDLGSSGKVVTDLEGGGGAHPGTVSDRGRNTEHL